MQPLRREFGTASSVTVAGIALMMMAGCSVRLPVAEATARAATEAELRQIAADGEGAGGIGRWTQVTVVLSRGTVKRITSWELYASIYVADCGTKRTIGVVSGPEIDGVAGDDFHALDALLAAQPGRRFFPMSGFIFERPNDFGQQCLRLEGGNYTFQEIASDSVPIRSIGPTGSSSEPGIGK